MTSEDATAEFVRSLEDTRAALVCLACRRLPTNPVKYLVCRHTVCASHTGKKGKFCPVCRLDVRGSDTVPDVEVRDACEALLQLEDIFRVEKAPTVSSVLKKKATEAAVPPTKPALAKRQIQHASNTSIADTPKTALEKRNAKGETPLHIACRFLKMDRILELLDKGANPNTKDYAGWTPLHEVTQKGSLEAVKLLLSYKALSDIPGLDNETPLHEAVRFGHIDIATELVKHGADVNAKNIKGETPLSLADDKIRALLLEAGDDVIQSQSETIKEISMIEMTSDFENMHVLCVVPYKTIVQKLKKLAKTHNFVIEAKFSKKVTHLIVDTEEDNTATSSVEILQALVNGVWILNYNWVAKSTEEHLEDFENHEIAGIFTSDAAPKRARFDRYKKLPGLFDGCHFYLHNLQKEYEISKSLILSKPILSKIITDAGGKVLRRAPDPESIPQNEKTVPYHAPVGSKLAKCSHYIVFPDIYEPMYNMQHLKALPIGWLLECIQKYEICDP